MKDEQPAIETERSAKKHRTPSASLRKLQRHASRLLAAGLLLLFVISTYAAVITVVVPKRYDLAVGAYARESVLAPREIVDKLTTEEHQRSAEYSVAPVQALDAEAVQGYEDEAAAYFESLKIVRSEAERIRAQKLALEEEENAKPDKTPKPTEAPELYADDWRSILTDADFSYLKSFLPMEFADIEVMNVLLAKEEEMLYLSDAVFVKIKMALRGGLDETSLAKAQTTILQELDAMSLTEDLKRVAAKAVNRYVAITLVKDEAATLKKQQEASAQVLPVVYKKGDTIVKQGEAVTPAQLEMLEELSLVRPAGQDTALYVGVGILVAVLMALFGSYVMLNRGEVLNRALLLGIIMLLTVGLAFLCRNIDVRINLTFVGVMLISLLIDERVAIAANIAFAFISALLCGSERGMILSPYAFEVLATTFAGGTVGIYLQRKAQKRGTLMLSGVLGGLTAAALMAAMALMLGASVVRALLSAAWVVSSYTVSAVLCIGTLPFWEAMFDITTASRLMELSNANHPALKRLMTEAPGTYHHSMMVASLAEAAAETVGTNSLLARVGAYYHDIGKLRRPLMFMENQKNDNPHDKLTAEESAAIILSHVRDGVTYAQKYKLPSGIQQIIFEHHGTTPVLYFYNKALQGANGKPVSLKSYRYPGSKPKTSESAIVMLADSVEAAVRSLGDQSREAIEQMVRKIVKGKIEDEQLSACPLTFADITAIERAFIASLSGMMHERIEYPNMPLLPEGN